jgi:peptidoglycan-associated lipoprotein
MNKLSKLLCVATLVAGVLAMSACSTTKKGSNGSVGSIGNGGAGQGDMSGSDLSSQGLGTADDFMGSGMSEQQLTQEHTYHFKYDSAQVSDADKPSVVAQARYLASNPDVDVLLAGNTDSRGSREYNIALGWRRAQSVEKLMLLNGARKSQIELVSYGEEKPVVLGDSEADYDQNRRVDLSYES